MLQGSTYSVHSLLIIVAIAEQRFVPDFLKDLQAIICQNPLESTPDGSPEPFVFSALPNQLIILVYLLENGVMHLLPVSLDVFPIAVSLLHQLEAELLLHSYHLICPDMTRLAKILALSSSFFLWELIRHL